MLIETLLFGSKLNVVISGVKVSVDCKRCDLFFTFDIHAVLVDRCVSGEYRGSWDLNRPIETWVRSRCLPTFSFSKCHPITFENSFGTLRF